MHIPDGYLSPQTYIPLYGAFVTSVIIAVKKVRKEISFRNIPFLGMASAFSFIIMMFNIPIPGGSSGHAVGAAVIAIILGPWSAIIGISVAVIVQALVFGDGGITSIGANCFNMAVINPVVAYFVFMIFYKLFKKKNKIGLFAFLSGYISLSFTALIAAIELGTQPLIAGASDGKALYCPYSLKITIPTMTIEHLFLFSIIEGIITALIVKYFVKTEPHLVYFLNQSKISD